MPITLTTATPFGGAAGVAVMVTVPVCTSVEPGRGSCSRTVSGRRLPSRYSTATLKPASRRVAIASSFDSPWTEGTTRSWYDVGSEHVSRCGSAPEVNVCTSMSDGGVYGFARQLRVTSTWSVIVPESVGCGKSRTFIRDVATDMYDRQIDAGHVPPNTVPMRVQHIEICPCGYPTHTEVTSCGTAPTNHASLEFWAVPVFPNCG